eukprot:CAMPEP_0114255026 /NCGR_PEP_ID=MMETSP0058-20121206/17326_1 /TAXON_ID=36894 /ORGANISM="Pyramimonas parkeae, CCMP726" /LENGTH=229 /DNA_ID=CAMNT_0001369351 /DNA_START=198 /DNA_END=887 /DNA_ORIENTATION=+
MGTSVSEDLRSLGEAWAMERSLSGDGFHRIIHMNFTSLLPGLLDHNNGCQMLVMQSLTNGLFADVYELEGKARVNDDQFQVFGDVNIERPATECSTSVVTSVLHIQETANSGGKASLDLPLHARYPAVARSANFSTVVVPLQLPRAFKRCAKSLWQEVSVRDGSIGEPLEWRVPAGIAAHAPYVNFITPLVQSLGAGAVLWATCRYGFPQHRYRSAPEFQEQFKTRPGF